MNDDFYAGQRWISESEPELGLGTILKVSLRDVQIIFPTDGSSRTYAKESAPLKRVVFKAGDKITDCEDRDLKVKDIALEEGLITYLLEDGSELPESLLSDKLSFSNPDDRLLNGHIDPLQSFDLRALALEKKAVLNSSIAQGFCGARIDMIPHQLYVADEVSRRSLPRVLLSDEVGLGKTIEAGLILHKLLISGRASRVLIIVPGSLVHQWFVEMWRKFNLWFTLVDEDRCQAVQKGDDLVNPFLEEQQVICSLEFLKENPKRQQQLVDAGWDLLVVDEAHHLEWQEGNPSAEYSMVEELSKKSDGVLLLTATPNQLGQEGHFARLKLLDPDRYEGLDKYLEESQGFGELVPIVNELLESSSLTEESSRALLALFPSEQDFITECLVDLQAKKSGAVETLVDALIDRHGTGRVMFRNTRSVMTNFPERELFPKAFDLKAEAKDLYSSELFASAEEAVESLDDLSMSKKWQGDERIDWLLEKLQEFPDDKFLLICKTKEKVFSLEAAIRERSAVKVSVFHEDLSLIQRDKNASYFASAEGCRILFCSEIGSEGRNFQFARHLILFDLPLNPGLLEQRIGRLDRIGQKNDIQIHVPYFKGTAHDLLFRWYDEGLDAFAKPLHGVSYIEEKCSAILATELQAGASVSKDAINSLIDFTKEVNEEVLAKLELGRDRLLEINSFRPKKAKKVIASVEYLQEMHDLEGFMEKVFDHFGITMEDREPHVYFVEPGPDMFSDSFPSLPSDGCQLTFNRRTALSREEIVFLTWDHPMVTGAIDLLLSSEQGNSSFARYPDEDSRTILLEAVYVLETVADKKLQTGRYLPQSPVRVMVNHKLENLSADFVNEAFCEGLERGDAHRLLDLPQVSQQLLPAMKEQSANLAEAVANERIPKAVSTLDQIFSNEISRLMELKKKNPNVRDEELRGLVEEHEALRKAIGEARLRLDALRLIWKGSESYLG